MSLLRNFELIESDNEIVNGRLTQAVGGPQTLASDAVIDSYAVTMTGGHTFIAGDDIVIVENDRFYQGSVLSVATNVLTLDTPIDYAFPSSTSLVFEVISNMNVDGSSTRQVFRIGTTGSVTKNIHLRGLRLYITDGVAMDDGKFGGISALTRGVVIQIVKADGRRFNVVNAKTNEDFGLAFDHKGYTDKASGGEYSVEFTWSAYAECGTIINITPGDAIEITIQDDLTTLTSFKALAFGQLMDS
jgi:hypothetical protein